MIGHNTMLNSDHKIDKPWNVLLYVLIAIGTAYQTLGIEIPTKSQIVGLCVIGFTALRSALDPSSSLNQKTDKEKADDKEELAKRKREEEESIANG